MATLNIVMKNEKLNKKFVSYNGAKVEEFAEKYVKGNGWECQISEDGSLTCIAKDVYNGVEYQMTYKILKRGEMSLILRIGDGPEIFLKKSKISRWPKDGILVLPAGYIDSRRPYFRYLDLQNLLDEYGLTAVCNQPANGIYELKKEIRKNKITAGEEIKTDGNKDVIYSEKKPLEENDDTSFTILSKVRVTGATWVIKKRFKTGIVSHKILYTTSNIKSLKGLPKPKE